MRKSVTIGICAIAIVACMIAGYQFYQLNQLKKQSNALMAEIDELSEQQTSNKQQAAELNAQLSTKKAENGTLAQEYDLWVRKAELLQEWSKQ